MSYVYARESGMIVAFMSEQLLEKAIGRGRKLDAITSDAAKDAMIRQIHEAGDSEYGEYGEWVRGLDLAGKTTEDVYGTYADVVKHWTPNV